MDGQLLFYFLQPAVVRGWAPVNDTVMGGVSESRFEASSEGAVFAGHVSLTRGGGFASARSSVGMWDLSGFGAVALRVRGDGQRYRLNLYAEPPPGALRYQAAFSTEDGAWHTHTLPFSAFTPRRRGQTPCTAPPLDVAHVRAFSLLIASEQAGPFRLEAAWIKAVRS